jgi:hypothetical protein
MNAPGVNCSDTFQAESITPMASIQGLFSSTSTEPVMRLICAPCPKIGVRTVPGSAPGRGQRGAVRSLSPGPNAPHSTLPISHWAFLRAARKD